MKSRDKKEIQGKGVAELNKVLQETQSKLFQTRLDHQKNKLKNTRSMLMMRKQVAILKTIINMKAKEETKN